MPSWIDLSAHEIALLVRKNEAGQNELVLKRLRPDANVPQAAVDYGFEPEGEIFVRRNSRFNLSEMLQIYPRAIVAELALEDIIYRAPDNAPVLPRPVPRSPAEAPREIPLEDDPPMASSAWTRVPLPRFIQEAVASQDDGQLWVEHSSLRVPAGRRRNEDAAKADAHRAAVENAFKAGERLPFEVLVDYPDLAYFGARKSHASTRVGKLLAQLGIAEKLMQGESGYARLVNGPYMDLVVERLPYPDGDRLMLTHYRDQDGDRILDAEMVFAIRDGRLYLKETAVENTLRGGELRGYDHYFANVFSRNLLEQGFGQAQVIWPHDEAPALERTEAAEPEPAGSPASFIQIDKGPNDGMVMAMVLDDAGATRLAVGMSRAAAAAALEEQPLSTAPGLPRRLGENLMGHVIWEDEMGRRQLRFGEAVLQESDDERGLEFLTPSEAKRTGQLSLVKGAPTAGALFFGRPVFRSLDGQHYAIEHRGDSDIHGFRLQTDSSVVPLWISLGEPWKYGIPSDSELRSATSQRSEEEFDQSSFIDEINEAIAESNVDQQDHLQIKPLDSKDLSISQPDRTSYEVRLADDQIPAEPVRIVADGEFWRASRGTAHSLRGPLETAFAWANRELANDRMHYLGNLHRAVDGNLHIGLPQSEFDLVRHVLHRVSIREQVQWKDLGLERCPETSIHRLKARDEGDGRMVVSVEGTQLAYELFALELHPSSTLSAYEKYGLRQVGGWLRQVDADVAWERTLQTHPDGSLLGERLRAYQDYQLKHYGVRFANRVPSEFARQMVLAVTEGNLDQLLEVLARSASSNPSTAKLFQDISGRSLGTNRASREAAIYAYCGYSTEDAVRHQAQRAGVKRVRMLEAEAKRTIQRCESFQVRYEGGVLTGREFVDRLFEEGYTHLHTFKRGAATRYGLMNPTSRSYYEIKEPLTSYVRHVLAIRESAQAAPAPELHDKLVPTL